MTSAIASLAAGAQVSPLWRRGWMLPVLALSLLSGIVLAALSDESHITTDTAHYMAVASNLLEGQGITTDIIYYEEQHRQGRIPAEQTVWPPGYPAMISLLALAGVSVKSAAFVIALIAHVLTPLLLAAVLLMAGVRQPIAASVAGAYTLLILPASYILACLSEPVFACVTLASFACIVAYARRDGTGWLLAGGALAAMSFMVRYPGVFFIAGLGVVFGARLLARRDARTMKECLLLFTIPAVVVTTFVLRNLAVTGRLSGNPIPQDGAPPLQLVKFLYWSVGKIFGFTAPNRLSDVVLALLGLGLAALTALVVRKLVRSRFSPTRGDAFQLTWSIAFAYAAVTLVALVYLGATAADWYLSDRYLTPLLPFLLVLIACGMAYLLEDMRRGAAAVMATLLAALVLGQAQVLRAERQWYETDDRYRTMAAALAAPYEETTLLGYLRARTTERSPALGSDAELLSAILERPVVGLPEDRYTDRHFDAAEARRLIRTYGIAHVLVFPRESGPGSHVQPNQPFMAALWRRQAPPWLRLISDQPAAQVYTVDESAP